MKKRTVNAFTLVEMLIVIVIIGILIAALMPRMQAAQGRARDVSRKTALSQVQSAIVTSQGDKGYWPGQCENVDSADKNNCAEDGTGIGSIETPLKTAGMNSVPVDPLKTTELVGLGNFNGNEEGDYAYMVTTRNGTPNGGFVLMAKTEVEGGSNWIVCTNDAGQVSDSDKNLGKGFINKGEDITNIQTCTSFDKDENQPIGGTHCRIESGTCYYEADGQLRYVVVY